MPKTILITGSTDGIGLEAAKSLASEGHAVILHGRSAGKIKAAQRASSALESAAAYQADLSNLSDVVQLATVIKQNHARIDVLINNAGVFNAPNAITSDGLDVRFVVNTLAPYLLTQKLLPLMNSTGRVINLSSAAQAPIDLEALKGTITLSANGAYAQSKLALTIWSQRMAEQRSDGPIIVSVNPGSFLGTKMVKEAYDMAGKDVAIGSDILRQLSVDPKLGNANGKYFDNDRGQFGSPHPDAMKSEITEPLMQTLSEMLSPYLHME